MCVDPPPLRYPCKNRDKNLDAFPIERVYDVTHEVGSARVVLKVAMLNPKSVAKKGAVYDPVTKWQYKPAVYIIAPCNANDRWAS
jgi:hypothetical protein